MADWLIREGGCTRDSVDFEVGAATDELWAVATLPECPQEHLLPTVPGRLSVGRRIPLAMVGVLSPWKHAAAPRHACLGAALALGNAVVLKPDVQTPVSGGWVAAGLFEEAGVGPGRRPRGGDDRVTESAAAGAVLLSGGTREGLFSRPTVLGGVIARMPPFREEVFGPVAPVVMVADKDEAVAVAQ